VPYFTLAATSLHPEGPWTKQRDLVPFRTEPGTYCAETASPGQVVKHGKEYLMFFSAAAFTEEPKRRLLRTLSIARTNNLDGTWKGPHRSEIFLDRHAQPAAGFHRRRRAGERSPTSVPTPARR
jgi:hypothetical protein